MDGTDLLYKIIATDVGGNCYVAYVENDADMIQASISDYEPVLLHALNKISTKNGRFGPQHDACRYFHDTLQDCFMGMGSSQNNEIGHPNVRKVYPIDKDDIDAAMFSMECTTGDTGSSRSQNAVYGSVEVYSSKYNKPNQSYNAIQSATINTNGGHGSDAYTMMMICAGTTPPVGVEMNKFEFSSQLTHFNVDTVPTERTSVIHVFMDGKHFRSDMTHTYDPSSVKSLHAPVCTMLRHLKDSGQIPSISTESAYMETVYTTTAIPMVVLRNSTSPIVALFEPHTRTCAVNKQYSATRPSDMPLKPNTTNYSQQLTDFHQYPENVRLAMMVRWGM